MLQTPFQLVAKKIAPLPPPVPISVKVPDCDLLTMSVLWTVGEDGDRAAALLCQRPHSKKNMSHWRIVHIFPSLSILECNSWAIFFTDPSPRVDSRQSAFQCQRKQSDSGTFRVKTENSQMLSKATQSCVQKSMGMGLRPQRRCTVEGRHPCQRGK